MAEERKPMIRRPRFLLFCLWMAFYIGLRVYGDIVHQVARMQDGRIVTREYIVGSDPSLPRWKRQIYRVVFSPLMVAEEEIRRLLAKHQDLLPQG